MAYSNFSLKSIKNLFGFQEISIPLFSDDIPTIQASSWLLEAMKKAQRMGMISEKVRSELLVMPILLELKTINEDRFSIFSGANLDADSENGLNGECDFILTANQQIYTLSSPIFCMVEAKKNDVELALGQCAAQMFGAKIYNQKDGIEINTIYGCVTTGIEWKFLKLEGNALFVDINYYFSADLPKLLGVLQTIINQNHQPQN